MILVKETLYNIEEVVKDYQALKRLGLSEEEIEGYFDLYEDNFDRLDNSMAYLIQKRKEASHEK